ncbi:MAG TPA: serine/threonine-protein kinase [Micromonosporaceae bacterium]|nr:serine/threonine-protein kinase [Micromonosporaceae bacterium]
MIGSQLQEGDLLARRYLLQERIGAGGMSVIWRAWDEALERVVAVKVLDGPLGADRGDRELIRREARAAARIDHPSAIQVYDYGETVTSGGRLAAYVVMQLLDGESVATRIDRDGPIPWVDAVSIAVSVADVLAAAHARGVVHRDVTPENVMLTSEGVKLLDFGIAAQVGEFDDTAALTFGTPPYVAPERLAGGEATGATDIYAVGVLLYEMLTGATPYPETTWHEIEAVRREGPPPPLEVPGLPARVASVYELCLSRNPPDRPTAGQVSTELAAALARSASAPARRKSRHRGRRLVAVAAVLSLLAAMLYVSLRYGGPTLRDGGTGVVAATATPNVAVAAPPTIGASGAPPSPTSPPTAPATRSATPSATPARSPSVSVSPAAPQTVNEAAAQVLALVDRGVANGDMRVDIAVDFKNQVNNLAAHRQEYADRIAGLRQRLRDRVREGALNPTVADQIDAEVVELGAVLERDVAAG